MVTSAMITLAIGKATSIVYFILWLVKRQFYWKNRKAKSKVLANSNKFTTIAMLEMEYSNIEW